MADTTTFQLKPIVSGQEGSKLSYPVKKGGSSIPLSYTEFTSAADQAYTNVMKKHDTYTSATGNEKLAGARNYTDSVYLLPDAEGDDFAIVFNDDARGYEGYECTGVRFYINPNNGKKEIEILAKNHVDSSWLWKNEYPITVVADSLNKRSYGPKELPNINLKGKQKGEYDEAFSALMGVSYYDQHAPAGAWFSGSYYLNYNSDIHQGYLTFQGNCLKVWRNLRDKDDASSFQKNNMQDNINETSAKLYQNFGYRKANEVIYDPQNYPESSTRATNPVEDQVQQHREQINRVVNGTDQLADKIQALHKVFEQFNTLRGLKAKDAQLYADDFGVAYQNELEKLVSKHTGKPNSIPNITEQLPYEHREVNGQNSVTVSLPTNQAYVKLVDQVDPSSTNTKTPAKPLNLSTAASTSTNQPPEAKTEAKPTDKDLEKLRKQLEKVKQDRGIK